MQLQVKFFASLRERFGESTRVVEAADGTTVAELWAALSGDSQLSDNLKVAVNYDYVDADHALQADDEVAFFPPVTGG